MLFQSAQRAIRLLVFSTLVLFGLLGTGCSSGSGDYEKQSASGCDLSVRLTWNPVTVDFQGNPVTVDGYRIYYGTQAGGPYTNMHSAGQATQTEVPGLCAGSYYFVATAFKGTIESGYSNQAESHKVHSIGDLGEILKVDGNLSASKEFGVVVKRP